MGEKTPLDVMQSVMRQLLDKGKLSGALAAARAAAPYVHGKVPAVRVGGDLAEVPDDELGECKGGGAGAAAADQG